MSKYSIKRLTDENFDTLKPLMLDCFGMNVDFEYFQWKFLDNPAGQVLGFLAISNETDEVAAYYGVIPELYMVDGEKKIIYQSCDTMTHSKHRRQGLFKLLSKKCFDTLRDNNKLFIIGFSGETSTPGFIKFGWKHVFDMKYYFIPKLPSIVKQKEIKNIETVNDYSLIEQLTINSNNQTTIHSHKSNEVFKWCLSNPRKKYITLAYKDKGEYLSYITYYKEGKKIYLFDFNLKDQKTSKFLINELKCLMHKLSASGIVAYTQENSILSENLVRYGFISNPFSKGPLSAKGPFIFYSIEDKLNKYDKPSSWLISSFDHDAM